MIPLVKKFVSDLLYSEEKATLWARGFLAWAGAMGAAVAAQGFSAMANWRTWVVAGVSGAALLFKAGDRNPPAP